MSLLHKSGATFSECGKYRYRLWRKWDATMPTLTFVMLNPSTADDVKNDATIERCQRRAEATGFGCLQVVNIFALRSTDPKALVLSDDPIGPDNNRHIVEAIHAHGVVICAWGGHGTLMNRGLSVIRLIRQNDVLPHYLVLNKDGTPKHPLYISYDVKPQPWWIGA